MVKQKSAKKTTKKRPLYTHLPTGEHFELVRTNPITLVKTYRSRRSYSEARCPTKITFARDYQLVKEL